MTANHDTPEAVEAMAVVFGAAVSGDGETASQLRRAAAMLRRLHRRAVDAEREVVAGAAQCSEIAGLCDAAEIERDEARASLATARADALREAYAAMDSLPEYARHLAERRVQQLIHKEPRHD